jgi:hypothetical protein
MNRPLLFGHERAIVAADMIVGREDAHQPVNGAGCRREHETPGSDDPHATGATFSVIRRGGKTGGQCPRRKTGALGRL